MDPHENSEDTSEDELLEEELLEEEEGDDHDSDDDDASWSDVDDEREEPIPEDMRPRGPSFAGVCLVVLLVCTAAIHIWAEKATRLPPLEPEPVEKIPDHPRIFHLVLTPRLSGDQDSTNSFGYHYCDDDANSGNIDNISCKSLALGDCEQSDNLWHKAAAKMAMAWIQSQPRNIFSIICNFQFMGPELDHYGFGRVKFVRLERERSNTNEFHFVFTELQPGSASMKFLETLRDEVRSGGDTWDCNDFGDVTPAIAAELGFRDQWEHTFASVASKGGKHVRLRVSLADHRAQLYHADSLSDPIRFEKACPERAWSYNNDHTPFQRAWYY